MTTQVEHDKYDRRGFWALFVVMVQGAFNDNVLKFLIVYALLAKAKLGEAALFGYDLGVGQTAEARVQGIATLVFSLPFILFPGVFGAISDRFSKKHVAIVAKILEFVLMLLTIPAFYIDSAETLFALLFLMTTQSALFGPAKYGILPESLPESRLSWANGIFAMGTLVAAIGGVALAGILHERLKHDVYLAGGVMAGIASLGVIFSPFITPLKPANPAQRIPLNPWSGIGRYCKLIWSDSVLFHVVIGYMYFWFAGLIVQNNVTGLSHDVLQLKDDQNSYVLGLTVLGIGIGSFTAGLLSRRKIELGLVPIGAAGLALFGVLLSFPGFGLYTMVALMFAIGFGAGFFDVPLAASLQHRSPAWAKGGIMATSNMLTFVGMALGGVMYTAFGELGLSHYNIFLFIGVFSLGVGWYMVRMLPIIPVRSVLWLLNSTFYRTHVLGRENVPEEGGALWVANHASFVDALMLLASTDREVHFVAGEDLLRAGWLGRVAKRCGVITYDPDNPVSIRSALQRARGTIAGGHIVCISVNGPLDHNGGRATFHDNFGELLAGLEAPIVPVHIDHLHGRTYTFEGSRFVWKKPPYWPYPIMVHYGAPMPHTASATDVKQAIAELGVAAYTQRPLPFPLIYHGFIKSARRNLRRMAIADLTTGELSYFKTLVGSIVFARKLKKVLDDQPMVGVLVPPSVGGLLTNAALGLLGKVPINLNYTASNEVIASCARQCGLTQVITSKKVLERLPIEVPGQTVFLEDIRETVAGKDRIVAMLIAFSPIWLIERILGTRKQTSDDVATIIFSSGSEGEPKGVQLTHRNLIYNGECTIEVFPHDRETCLIGFLPFFHSFGFMVTVWMVITHGFRAVYHPSPLEPKQIGTLVEKYGGSIMIGTSTFLQSFIRRCTPEQMKSLRFVVCGAEKLSPRVRDAFMEKFGVEPLEGYGTTECSPAVSVNIPDIATPGFCHRGTKRGTIGRLMPGQAARTIDADTEQVLPRGETGVLCIKGANIMKGYLNLPEKTGKVLQDGWYATGDIAQVDSEGFITITDRLARFSKIAGEMVPHTKVEETLHQLIDLTDLSMAVASVPDPQKGERLVVLHTLSEEQLDELAGKLDGCGLPNLWIPRASAFYRVEAIPVLGTGKLDIRAVKKTALALDLGE